MAGIAQSIFSSEIVGFLLMLLLFVVFLLPFDRRFIERYIMQIGAKPAGAAPVSSETLSANPATTDGSSETIMPGGPYTRRLCHMLDLEVVVLRDLSSSHLGPRFLQLAIGRWNEEAWEFDVVTEWCETWEDLEEEARRAIKSFRGVATPNYRRASNV
jgi:hypothetical protein